MAKLDWIPFLRRTRRSRGPLRVLFALRSYPQLSQSYMHLEIVAAQRLGVIVEVWAPRNATIASDSASARVHRGTLKEAIAAFDPHVIHKHWLSDHERVRSAAKHAQLPMTIRAHSFDAKEHLLRKFASDRRTRRIYLFPHIAERFGHHSDKIHPLPQAFDPQRFRPGAAPDPKLVLRVATGRPESGCAAFLRIAARSPEHRFICVIADGFKEASHYNELMELNQSLGNPVEIRINLQYSEMAELVPRAGIYLYTIDSKNYGMPISIAESMATGAYVLSPQHPGADAYIGDAGTTYKSEDEAVELLAKTLSFTQAQWQEQRQRSIARANANFSVDVTFPPVVEYWKELRRGR